MDYNSEPANITLPPEKEPGFFARIYNFFDPYRIMPWFVKINIPVVIIMAASAYGLYWLLANDKLKNILFLLWFLNIGIHEAGHPIFNFLFFGNEFMHYIGGCATEILVPLLAFLFFIRRGKTCQAYVCFAWLGFSFYSVGHYALSTSLPTITLINANADTVSDWEYLHGVFGTLKYDVAIGHAMYAVGAALFVFGVYAFIRGFQNFLKEPLYK
ncbi:MAG: hypothetical protein FWF35_05070 [Elusimicrobia bacterium]|nr:hypothetical protein [Elusimicrobiota bacterium]